jgi:hypothetical protein
LVRVPRGALLTAAEARRCAACAAAAAAAAAPLSEWQLLCLALLHQRNLGAASAWAPYLAVLPPQPRDEGDAAAFAHPLLWPDAFAAQALAGSPMLVRYAARQLQRCALTRHPCAGEAALARGDVR